MTTDPDTLTLPVHTAPSSAVATSYVRWPDGPLDRAEVGGKAFALAALRNTDVAVPAWFALTPAAFINSLAGKQRRAFSNGTVPHLDTLIPCADVVTALDDALGRLASAGAGRFAVRSSAVDEDGARQSYAGQLASFLDVPSGEVAARVADVWRSAFHPRVESYRRAHGLSGPMPPPAVLVQRMVDAACSGVAFSADPASGRRGIAVVSAVAGTGAALVDGAEEGATCRVDRTSRITGREDADAGQAMLDEDVRRVAALARAAERHFGRPQDVEWALEDGRLFLLQSRPVTTLRDLPDPDGAPTLWDDSNIAESYAGVTTPLTFSFARRAYRSVYRTFCRTLHVPEAKIDRHGAVFDSMIGLLGGRLYYDLMSWYRVLSLLPGFRFNRTFMEDMMGVRERLPEAMLPDRTPASWVERARDGWHLARSALSLIRHHRNRAERVATFRGHVDRTLAPPEPPLEAMRLDELAAYYRHLEDELLRRWDVPIVNDFLTMVFFGLSRRLLATWTEDGEQLHGQLLANSHEIASAEPARHIRTMANVVSRDETAIRTLATGSQQDIRVLLKEQPTLQEHLDAYVDRFGDRCLGELKLESLPLHEDPMPLLRAVGALAQRRRNQDVPSHVDFDAGAALDEALHDRPLRRRLVRWTLRHARARIADREALRFDRTRVFGRARRIFVEIGRRLFAVDRLAHPRDVFYLEVDELLGFVDGTATTADLAGLVAVRKAEYACYQDELAPTGRLTTYGAVHQGNTFEAERPAVAAPGDTRTGLGCGTGRVRGRVQVVRDPRGVVLDDAAILVAERTDPGWVALFAATRGIVVERGNLLSHAAVVAREIGLPAVVSVDGATHWLRTGDLVEIDGRAGTVRRVEKAAPAMPDARPQTTERPPNAASGR